jgi:lipopolysaccharide export system protein LptA
MKTLGLLIVLLFAAAGRAAEPALETPPSRPGLLITADFLVAMLKSNAVIYSNNVLVVDPPAKPGDSNTTLRCQSLTARRGEDGKIDAIIAHGRVEIDQGDTHARGGHAVYTGTNDVFMLTEAFDPGDTALPARPFLFSTQDNMRGTNEADVIIYDRKQDKIFFRNVRTQIDGATLQRAETNSAARGTNDTKARPPRGPTSPFKL